MEVTASDPLFPTLDEPGVPEDELGPARMCQRCHRRFRIRRRPGRPPDTCHQCTTPEEKEIRARRNESHAASASRRLAWAKVSEADPAGQYADVVLAMVTEARAVPGFEIETPLRGKQMLARRLRSLAMTESEGGLRRGLVTVGGAVMAWLARL